MKFLRIVAIFVVFVAASFSAVIERIADDENAHDQILAVNERLRRGVEDGSVETQIINLNEKIHKDYFEGDIVFPEKSKNQVEKRSAIQGALCPKEIPYEILVHHAAEKIKAVHRELEQKTCLKFRPKRSGDDYWMKYFQGSGCYSYLGKVIRNGQEISIGRGCEHHGIIMHETMHALGFLHEQSRPDRDTYVNILFQNIRSGMEGNFRKATTSSTQGLDYDYGSVMHYGKTAFSKNGQPTITARDNPSQTFGQRGGPSELDIKGINIKYGCAGPGPGPGPDFTQWSQWTSCNGACEQTRERRCKTTKCPNTDSNGVQTESRAC